LCGGREISDIGYQGRVFHHRVHGARRREGITAGETGESRGNGEVVERDGGVTQGKNPPFALGRRSLQRRNPGPTLKQRGWGTRKASRLWCNDGSSRVVEIVRRARQDEWHGDGIGFVVSAVKAAAGLPHSKVVALCRDIGRSGAAPLRR